MRTSTVGRRRNSRGGIGLGVCIFLCSCLLHAQELRKNRCSSAGTAAQVETFELKSKIFDNTRTIRILLPPGYQRSRKRYPVFYINDGFAVFDAKSWNAPAIASNLMCRGAIRPLIFVGIDNGATAANGSEAQRTKEYLPYVDLAEEPSVPKPQGSRYPEFLINEVMPAVSSRYRIKSGAEDLALGGASYGGLIALYTLIARPGVFGKASLESPSLFIADFNVLKEARTATSWPKSIIVGIGGQETPNREINLQARENMQRLCSIVRHRSPQTRCKVNYGPADTHGSDSWQRRLPSVLMFLWPPAPGKAERQKMFPLRRRGR